MKQQRKTALTQERILHASMLEFGKKGYAQATISEICSTGNVPKGLIYHNFKGKDELYLLSLKKVYDDFIDYLADIEEPLTMQQYMQRRLSFFSDHPMYARLFFESILHPPEQLEEKIKELKHDFDVLNQKLYRMILSKVTLRKDVTSDEAMAYYMMVQEMFNAFFSSPAFGDENFDTVVKNHEEQLARFLDFMIYGVAEKERNV